MRKLFGSTGMIYGILFAFGLTVFVANTFPSTKEIVAQERNPVTKWEYKVIQIPTPSDGLDQIITKALNNEGALGWEFAAETDGRLGNGFKTFILKRQIK